MRPRAISPLCFLLLALRVPAQAVACEFAPNPVARVEGIVNPIGTLDGNGSSTGLALQVPNVAAAQHLGLHLQALLITPTGLCLTNGLSLFVR